MTRERVLRNVVALVAMAPLIVPPTALAVTAGRKEPIGVTSPVDVVNADRSRRESYSAPSLVVDPDDPLRVYVAAVELGTRRCVFFRSSDGGKNWKQPPASPSLPAFPFCTHTSQFRPMTALAMGRDNTIYYLHQGWSHQDEGEVATTSVFLARSIDGGTSWSVTAVHDARRLRLTASELNYPIDLEVDAHAAAHDVVYASWTTTYPGSAPAKPSEPMLAVSGDGGRSFSRPMNATGTFFDHPANIAGDIRETLKLKEHFGGREPDLAIDGVGNLYVAWVRTSEVLDPVPPQPRYLSKSSDGGKTFDVSELTAPSPFAGPGPLLEWSRAGGPTGSLQVVYEDKVVPDQGDRDVLHRRSTDGGATWSEVRTINEDDPAQLFTQLLPNMSVAADGRVDLTWWDQRAAHGRYAVDLYSSSSADGGATWSINRRLTDASVERRSGTWVDHHGDTRQPPATGSTTAVLQLVWDTARNGGPGDASQGLRGAVVQFAELSRRSHGLVVHGVSVAGGLAAGVLAVQVRRRSRRRRTVL